MDQLSELKAMMTQFGNAIAKLEQKQGLNPQTPSIQANATEQTSNISPLSGSSQSDGVNQEQKTYSIAQNNLSRESGQSQNSSELLAESQSVSDDNNSKTYFSPPSTSFSLLNEEVQAKTSDSILPNWIVQVHKENQFKNVFFNSYWYKNKLDTSSWKDFNLHINELADVCVNQLETYFSTKQKPKQTRLMHSTERHHLSVTVTIHFPSLVSKYAEFQLQHKKGTLNCSQIKTSPKRTQFMEYFFYKISSRMDYSYKAKDDQNREVVPLRKPLVSQAMKRNAKNHPSVLKKMKPDQ